MIELGRYYDVDIESLDQEGAWAEVETERLLLPQDEVPETLVPGDRLRLFAYQRLADRVMTTLETPLVEAGQFAALRVHHLTPHGAFLSWGPEKDLLVPFSEQPERMEQGRAYMVKVCLDDRGRLFGTARIDLCLEWQDAPFQAGQEVELVVWQYTPLGAKVIVNELYPAMLYQDELRPDLRVGTRVQGYIKQVREDKKIDVTLRKVGREASEDAVGHLRQALAKEGFLPLHDKSAPEEIEQALGISKKLFKKAVGALYKAGEIRLSPEGIYLKAPSDRRDR